MGDGEGSKYQCSFDNLYGLAAATGLGLYTGQTWAASWRGDTG